VFSASSARGLLIGVGNVGDRLNPLSYADTFLSRDAGLSWNQIAKGPSIYEFGNHGTILLLAERNQKLGSVRYSLDSGKTWCNLSISDMKESEWKIRDIITEPSSTKRSFLLIGTRIKGTLSPMIEEPGVIQLDFSQSYSRECNMPKDFEPWRVSDKMKSHGCHMGHNVGYSNLSIHHHPSKHLQGSS
jgi:hypothetical protein